MERSCHTMVEGSGASGADFGGSSKGYSGVRFQTEQPHDVVARSPRHQAAVQYAKRYPQRPSFLSVHLQCQNDAQRTPEVPVTVVAVYAAFPPPPPPSVVLVVVASVRIDSLVRDI